MDKTPKERIVFDEGVYYGDEGSEISIEDITSREGITVEEVLDSYTEEAADGLLDGRVGPR